MRIGKLVLLVLTAVLLTVCILGSALADVKPIPLDINDFGTPPKAEGWIVPEREYQDESIHVILDERKNYDSKSSDGNITIRWVVIEIKDPSQLRTMLSGESFEDTTEFSPAEMVAHINPVVACNDDYVKMNNYKGYVMRQGVLYSDNLDDWSEDLKQDVLIIDDQGDFSVVQRASSADVQAFIAELEGQGRKAVNTFTFGPTLVLNGEAQEIRGKDSTHTVITATARTAICQLDTLKYAIFAADCPKTGYGMNCQEMANFIVKVFPECKIAYNLDGGNSSSLFMGKKKVNKTMGKRNGYGMIYFASAVSED